MDDGLGDGLPDDAHIEPEAPVLHVPDVVVDAAFHLPQLLGLATESCHLSPARDAGLHKMTHHILVYQLTVYLRMVEHMGPRAHDAHVALEHVEKLGQLVDIGLAHEVAKGKLARVVLGGLHQVGILIDMHRAELVAIEVAAVDACSGLFEEDGPGTLDVNGQGDEGNKRQEAQQHARGDHDVKRTLDKLVAGQHERLVVIGKHGRLAHQLLLERMAKHGSKGRHIIEVYRVVVAIAHQLADKRQLAHGQSAIEFLHPSGLKTVLHDLGHIIQGAFIVQPFRAVFHGLVGIIAIDVVTDGGVAHQIFIDGEHGRISPYEHHAALVVTMTAVALHSCTLHKARHQDAGIKRQGEDGREAEVGRGKVLIAQGKLRHEVGGDALQEHKRGHLAEHLLGSGPAVVDYGGKEVLGNDKRQIGQDAQLDGTEPVHQGVGHPVDIDIYIEQDIEHDKVKHNDPITYQATCFRILAHKFVI